MPRNLTIKSNFQIDEDTLPSIEKSWIENHVRILMLINYENKVSNKILHTSMWHRRFWWRFTDSMIYHTMRRKTIVVIRRSNISEKVDELYYEWIQRKFSGVSESRIITIWNDAAISYINMNHSCLLRKTWERGVWTHEDRSSSLKNARVITIEILLWFRSYLQWLLISLDSFTTCPNKSTSRYHPFLKDNNVMV